ncbi:MAG: pyridoxamine 5'-phosphate oxidase family protein [Gemmatimonadota bacterium]|jgi:nitroimidazol reductase NimA-like FMN-containing flavoprotein (pyridoxamine 5'-phosphate oxidase superfamily)|nr:pyridoxamine 5'-phosphate oxidase family protein [Gemmatimonadota bacterium]
MNSTRVKFRELNSHEINAVLSRNHIGRIAFSQGNRTEIIPVNYVFTPEWIYGRTTPGGLIEQIGETWWPVAFEVDEVRDLFNWESVVIHGGLYVVPENGSNWQREAWREGLDLLRQLVPETFEEGDPVPGRQTIFRIAIQETVGKAACRG